MTDYTTYPDGFNEIVDNLDFLEDDKAKREAVVMGVVFSSLFY